MYTSAKLTGFKLFHQNLISQKFDLSRSISSRNPDKKNHPQFPIHWISSTPSIIANTTATIQILVICFPFYKIQKLKKFWQILSYRATRVSQKDFTILNDWTSFSKSSVCLEEYVLLYKIKRLIYLYWEDDKEFALLFRTKTQFSFILISWVLVCVCVCVCVCVYMGGAALGTLCYK